jgi:hypothetical protein
MIPHRTSILLVSTLIFMAGATSANAQADSAAVRRAQLLQRLQPGTTLRVSTAADPAIGRLVRVGSDSLYLDAGAYSLSPDQRIWLQQRSTSRGMKAGAIIGAPAGAAFGAFFMLLVSGLCEYDCPEDKPRAIALGALGFGAFGGLAGGTIGAVVGASIPRWLDIDDPRIRLPTTDDVAASVPVTIGSLAVTPALAGAANGGGLGAGARATYMFHLRRAGLGLEAGAYDLGNDTRVAHAGGLARFGAGFDRRLEPYVTLGTGLYSWSDVGGGAIQLGGYSAGAGINVRSASRKQTLFAEARWQDNLTISGDLDSSKYGFYTIGIGGSLAW